MNSSNSLLRWMTMGLMVAVTGFSVVVGYGLSRMIVPPIERVTLALEQVALKDLNVSVEVASNDELGRLSGALNTTVESMRSALRSVAHTAEVFSGISVELSFRSHETSSNTHDQTAKISQIAAAVAEIAVTIRTIQAETHDTAEVMSLSSATVESGLRETTEAQSSIGSTITASHELGKMIELIATAASQQASASGEIGQNAGEISQLAEENSQASQEIAEACNHLSQLASDLDGIIRQFNLGNGV